MRLPRTTYIWSIPKGTTPHIWQTSKRQLSIYHHNSPTTSPVTNVKNKQRKGNDPKYEDMDNITSGTTGVHIEDTTTNKDTTAPSGGVSLGAHISETSQTTSRPSRTVEGILGAHPKDGTFWEMLIPLMCLLTL